MAIVFYGSGNLFRKLTESETEARTGISLKLDSGIRDKFSKAERYLPVIATLLSVLYLGYLLKFPTENQVNMNVLQYGGNFFSFHILAFTGIFTFVYLFKKIGSSTVLEYYGRNSLIILALHFPIKDVVTRVAAIVLGVNTEYFYYNAGFALGFTVLNLILLVPVIYVINNYLPFLFGKKGSSKSFNRVRAYFRKSAT